MTVRNIYLASSWRNEEQPFILAELREAGHSVYDFRNPAPGNTGFHWSEIDPRYDLWGGSKYREALDHPLAEEGFLIDFNAMRDADVCVLLLPCGRSAHLEAGWFVGADKPLLILLDDSPVPELMYKMATAICTSLSRVLAELQRSNP